MDSNSIIITWALGILSTLLTSIVLWKLRAQTEKNEKFSASIVKLENTAVSDEHVRKVVREEMAPVNAALPKILESMHLLETFVAEERGFKAGQRAARTRLADTQ